MCNVVVRKTRTQIMIAWITFIWYIRYKAHIIVLINNLFP